MNLTLMQILRKISFRKSTFNPYTTQLLLFAAGILVLGVVGGYFYPHTFPNTPLEGVEIYFQKTIAPRMIEICESGKRPVSIALAGDLLIGGRTVWQQIVNDNNGGGGLKKGADTLMTPLSSPLF